MARTPTEIAVGGAGQSGLGHCERFDDDTVRVKKDIKASLVDRIGPRVDDETHLDEGGGR